MEDAINLIKAAHKSDLRIIVDLVPNHFSTEHQWFKAALQSLPGSLERSRFHFYDGRGESGEIPPNNWCSIFGGPAWSRVKEIDGRPGQWYLHLFDSTQADLNWENTEVKEDFEKTLRFWLDKGVDGFRIDVAHGLVKEEIFKDHRDPEGLTRALRLDVSDMDRSERESLLADVPFFDREGVHEIYRGWRKILDSYSGQRMSVAEAWVHPSSRAMRYVRSDELHQIFNFDFLIAPWDAEFLVNAINKTLAEVRQVGASPTWVLSNHDSPRLVTRLGGGQLGRQRARAMALLTHGLPGGIYIYQGEELGLEDGELEDRDRQDPVFFRTKGVDKGRDGARIPLPWSSQLPNYGFTTTKPWLPIPSTWQEQCVESQIGGDSHLTLYRQSLHMRKLLSRQLPASNEITWIATPKGVLAFSRGDDFLLYANTTGQSHQLKLESDSQIILASSAQAHLEAKTLSLPAQSTVWLGKITK